MGGDDSRNGAPGYGLPVGMVYCFNLMMGAGLLALPKAFVQGGYLLGVAGISILAFMSYSTVTFIIEAQSVHNALERHRAAKKGGDDGTEMDVVANKNALHAYEENNNNNNNNNNNVEKSAPIYRYEITMQTALGELCNVFLNKFGYIVFYVAFCLYLFGSSSIYAAAISKSLASIVCNDQEGFHSGNATDIPCSTIPSLKLMQTYRVMLAVFVVVCCPFAFFTLSGTKVLQLSTMAFRFFALTAMMVLAFIKISSGEKVAEPKKADFSNMPNFISTAIYAFMCQYSIPSVITPISNKKNIRVAVFIAFSLVLSFCVCLSMTAVYAFKADDVQDLYTLTFTKPEVMKYILELFPVLTLGANFPVIAIVLRDNIKTLFLGSNEDNYGIFVRRILFPIIAVTPSIVISYCTYDVGLLVGYTGAYAGAIIQYVIPVFLVYSARRKAQEVFGEYENKYASPLRDKFWLVLVLVWYVVSLGFVTYSKVTGFTGGV